MAKLKVEWANSRALKAKIRPERDDLRPGWSLGGWTDGWTDRRKGGQMDACLKIHPCGLQDIGPLTPLLKKAKQVNVIYIQLNSALTEPPLTEFRI